MSTLIEVYSDSFRDDYNGQPLIYSRDFIENVRFRRWSRFMNDMRRLCYFGALDMDVISKDVIEVTILLESELTKNDSPEQL
jgi:hypothetical protein